MSADERPTFGHFEGVEHRLPVRVYYEDTDAGGVVYHANYLRFMERGRSTMMSACGVDQVAARDEGVGHYVVTEVAIRYLRPARLHDELVVVSRLTELGRASSVIQQRVMRGAEVLTEATVRAAFLSLDGRPKRQPAAWMAIFEGLIAPHG